MQRLAVCFEISGAALAFEIEHRWCVCIVVLAHVRRILCNIESRVSLYPTFIIKASCVVDTT